MSVRLALETSGALGSVALARGGVVVARRVLGEKGRHAAALPGAIAAVLQEADVRAEDVAAVGVGAGPGSFTGVRVAGAAANGFAHALGIPVVPVSSLAAAALAAPALLFPEAPPLRVVFDARGDRLFTAVYRVTPSALVVVEPPRFTRLPELLTGEGGTACGAGALRHRTALETAGIAVVDPPVGVPTADGVLAAWERGAGGAPVQAGGWEPHYLRDTGAVRARRAAAE